MENKGLLFIPDMSGFTRFVNDSEIMHSRLIIQELLETLINANQMGLRVSEIEGDAILFYKFGDLPDLAQLYQQVEKMFCDFHRHLIAYEQRRFCQCKACSTAINLSLKVISHYGEFADYSVKNFNKLIGKDIIVAHQLLKNDIEQHEYWLVTKQLLHEQPPGFKHWMQWSASIKQTEAGEIPFHYTQLSQLKKEIQPELFPELHLDQKRKMFSLTKEYDTDILTLFHATGDFNYRSRWREGVKAVEMVSHHLPRVGTRCRCLLDNGQSVIYASSYTYHPDRIEFSETNENEKSTVYFTLDKISADKTRLSLDFYIQKNIASGLLFKLLNKKKTEERFNKSLHNLDGLLKEINFSADSDLWEKVDIDDEAQLK
jgi:hypothetical protein